MSDLKELISALNNNIGKDQSAKEWSKMLPERENRSPWGGMVPSATENSRAAKCGQWLNVFSHLGFVDRTATKIGEKKVSYTFKPIKEIPYRDL